MPTGVRPHRALLPIALLLIAVAASCWCACFSSRPAPRKPAKPDSSQAR